MTSVDFKSFEPKCLLIKIWNFVHVFVLVIILTSRLTLIRHIEHKNRKDKRDSIDNSKVKDEKIHMKWYVSSSPKIISSKGKSSKFGNFLFEDLSLRPSLV